MNGSDPNQIRTSSRLASIDALRGFAALAVVVLHGFTWVPPQNAPAWYMAIYSASQYGHWGVPLFFVISGFCIHMSWARNVARGNEPRFEFVAFWKRRFTRLYPPYLVTLIFSMAMVLVAYLLGGEAKTLSMYPPPFFASLAKDFALHVSMLHGFSSQFDSGGGNPPFWSLAREEYYYMLYPVLLMSRQKFGLRNTVVAAFLISVTATVAFFGFQYGPYFLKSIALWGQWVLGMLAVEVYCGLTKLPRWCNSVSLAAVASILAVLTLGSAAFPILTGLAFLMLVAAVTRLESCGKWPTNRVIGWFSKVGVFSYSLYLVHHPIRAVGKTLLDRVAAPQSYLAQLAASMLLIIMGYYGGRIFFWAVERHFLRPATRDHHRSDDRIPSKAVAVAAD